MSANCIMASGTLGALNEGATRFSEGLESKNMFTAGVGMPRHITKFSRLPVVIGYHTWLQSSVTG